ncbi:MAG: SMC family ATPase [Clostridiales bacterium]|nr:SMC family ATPase [Clostridiales bacterium]
MKPISLVIDGINSFYDRQEVDFRFDGLFCINGDTGSGKTTILDCIIIALYGSNKRTSVMSDYINLRRDKAEIVLVFETTVEGERQTFEVTRTLSRNAGSRAKLINLTTGETIAEQTNSVNEALAAMIGLTRDDFTQVVILEQGKFAKFLTAGKAERNVTVSNLFKLHKYRELGSKFNTKMRETKTKLDSISEQLNELKDVTAAAVAETEKGIRGSKKRIDEIAEAESKLSEEIAQLNELKRIFDKCVEAEQRLTVEQQKAKELQSRLANSRDNVAATNEQLKEATRLKAEYELIAQRTKDLASLIEQLNNRKKSIDRLRSEWKAANFEAQKYEKELAETSEKVRKLNTMLSSRLSDIFLIADFGEKGGYCDVFDIKSKADRLSMEMSAAQKTYADCDKKVDELSAKVKLESEKAAAAIKSLSAADEVRAVLKKEVDELKQKREDEQRAEAARFIRQGLKEGDVCPVCGGRVAHHNMEPNFSKVAELLAQKELELIEADSKYNTIKNNSYSFNTLVDESKKLLLEAQGKLSEAEQTLNKYRQIIKQPDKTDALTKLAAEACDIQNKLTKAEGEEKVAAQKHQAASEKAARIKADGIKEGEEANKLQNVINERLIVSEEELCKNSEKLSFYTTEADRLTDLLKSQEATRDDLTAQCAAVEATVNMLKNEATNKPAFDGKILQEKKETAEKLTKEREELIAKIAASEKELEVLKLNLERKRSLEADKADKKKMYDIYADIYKLVSGDKFIEYIAEEYILQFTAAASLVLNDITGGKYTLEYMDGEFFVKDFLAGGLERKAGTLSGGETFLASLSLAIAISREIARYKTYEFFFLDEGFGTLDSNSLDTVVNALVALSNDTLVGVVTHRSELTDRIFDKINVLPSGPDHGSRVERSD